MGFERAKKLKLLLREREVPGVQRLPRRNSATGSQSFRPDYRFFFGSSSSFLDREKPASGAFRIAPCRLLRLRPSKRQAGDTILCSSTLDLASRRHRGFDLRRLHYFVMNWPEKTLFGGVYCLLLLLCSSLLSALLACISAGALPFTPLAAFALCWLVLFYLWYVLLFFGFWVALLPPRGLLAWFAFSAAAVAAGFLASSTFQVVRPWDFEHEAVPSAPPPVQMVSLTTLLSCITALLSTAICLWLVRCLFRWLLPDHRLWHTQPPRGDSPGLDL